MLTKNRIKDIQSLYHKNERDEQGLFIAEGPKITAEIMNSGLKVEMIYGLAEWRQSNEESPHPFTEISEMELQRISQLQTPNEVLVVAKQQRPTGEPYMDEQLTLVLDGIQDPGNMGTLIRTADWFGFAQIVCSLDCADIYNAKVVQSSMGSIFRIQCWYKLFEEWDIPADLPIYGAMLQGQNVFSVGKVKRGLLVIGNESKGIRPPMLPKITNPITIPKSGRAESLNAAVAAGIIMGQMANGE